MTFDAYEDAPGYGETRVQILAILKKAKKPMSMRELKKKLGTDEFLWDALEALKFSGLIEDVGGVLISRFKYVAEEKQEAEKTAVCSTCRKTKPLIDFYQEWSGAPSKKCKTCKSAAVRKRQKAVKG